MAASAQGSPKREDLTDFRVRLSRLRRDFRLHSYAVLS
jgi:hypothetical protein